MHHPLTLKQCLALAHSTQLARVDKTFHSPACINHADSAADSQSGPKPLKKLVLSFPPASAHILIVRHGVCIHRTLRLLRGRMPPMTIHTSSGISHRQ